ncbi:MAG: UvrB/UvrC motif-containing protein, partial [Candidatus Omnitrophica bacterium]|nr:UvrB/UvrC motif-containing protein [Candidatus Omnitrophota bacterium]
GEKGLTMLCDICGKNEATVHLTEIINNAVTKLHLCEDCAKTKASQMEEQFGLAELLGGLADFGLQIESAEMSKLKCSNCGFTYMDFKKVGRLGCGEGYNAFQENLTQLLRRIHGSDQHYGKAPIKAKAAVKVRDGIQELKARLAKAVQLEEFEEAAKLRDQIRESEKKIDKKKTAPEK